MKPRIAIPAFAALLLSLPASAAPWKALAASGPVESRRGVEAAWASLSRGETLAAHDGVRTGRRGRATLAQGRTVLVVDPDTEVSLPVEGAEPRVLQAKGSVVYDVDGKTHRGMRVETPFLVAGVKGTVFLVSVRDGRAIVSVREGLVAVTSKITGEVLDVAAGETAVVDDRGALDVVDRGEIRDADLPRDVREVVKEESRKLEKLSTEETLVSVSTHTGDLLSDTKDLLDTDTTLVEDTRAIVEDVSGTVDETTGLVEEVANTVDKLLPPLPILP